MPDRPKGYCAKYKPGDCNPQAWFDRAMQGGTVGRYTDACGDTSFSRLLWLRRRLIAAR